MHGASGTNTFLNGYARRAHCYDFNTVRFLFAGAEKVQTATFDTWAQQFGIRVLEGYGATECSPFISVNTRIHPAYGSVGRPLPGMECRLEPVDGVEDAGRLLVRGPNVMKGYVNEDANERFKSLGGWYDTGDIVSIDEKGYLYIRGRLKRFAKVSGEMVSLAAVETAISEGVTHLGPKFQVAVLACPDPERGESLVAVANDPRLTLADMRTAIHARGLGNICFPREVFAVGEIPTFATGKVDYPACEKLLSSREPAETSMLPMEAAHTP